MAFARELEHKTIVNPVDMDKIIHDFFRDALPGSKLVVGENSAEVDLAIDTSLAIEKATAKITHQIADKISHTGTIFKRGVTSFPAAHTSVRVHQH